MITKAIGRPIAATFILGAILTLAALYALVAWADLVAAEDEQQVKAEFVSRGVHGLRHEAGPATDERAGLAVDADTETLAAAQIDALVRSTASEAGGSVLSSRADAKHDGKGLAGRLEVVAEIEATNDVLQTILLRLESGAPTLLIQGLTIEPATTGDVAVDQDPRLHADLIVDGYWGNAKK